MSNNQFKYDITYSTQYQHDLWVNGPDYDYQLDRLYTTSTSLTSTTNHTSNNLLFHLVSDSISSSRLIDVRISDVYIQTATRSISASPIQSYTPSLSQGSYYYQTYTNPITPIENNSSSNIMGIVALIGGGFILVTIIVGITFFVINQQKKIESASSTSDSEKKYKHKNGNTPQNYTHQNGQTSQQYPPHNYPDPKSPQYYQQFPPNPNQYNQQYLPNPNQYNQQPPPFKNGLNNSFSPNQQQPVYNYNQYVHNPNNNEIKK